MSIARSLVDCSLLLFNTLGPDQSKLSNMMEHRHVCCPAGMSATGRVSTARRSGGGTKRPTPPTFCRQASFVHAGGVRILLAACSLKSAQPSLSCCESRAHDFVLGTVLHPPRFPFGLCSLLLCCLQHGHRDIQHDYELRNVLGQGALPCFPVAFGMLVQQGGATALCSWRRLG